jgi:hypothetical protein
MSISSAVKTLLDISWYLVAITLGLAVCVLFVLVVNTRTGNMELGVPVSFDLNLQAHQITDARGTLVMPIQRGRFLYASFAVLIGLLTLALWILSQLRAVFRSLGEGRPFVPANVRRIRLIGVGVIAGQLAWAEATFAGNYYSMSHFVAVGLTFAARPSINPIAIIHGLVILAIAEVFKEGTRLEEDQSLTV